MKACDEHALGRSSRCESCFRRPWDWIEYGGLLEGPVFDATGFFRTERRDDRWWLVTPEGHGFFSIGIDVVSPDVGATFVEGRDSMLGELPDFGEPSGRALWLCG